MPQRYPLWRLACFLAGQAAVLLAIASPLDTFAPFLLWVHMAQHLLLLAVVPPLLWLGEPLLPLLRGLPRRFRKEALGPFLTAPELRTAARAVTHPMVCWIAGVSATVFWHLPRFYELGLASPGWHRVEHLCFLAGSLLFWWPVFEPWPARRRTSAWLMIPYLISADVVNSALSAYLVFSPQVVYKWYESAPRIWGSALEDQVTAGLLMWVPGSLVYLAAAAAVTLRALGWGSGVRPSAHFGAVDLAIRKGPLRCAAGRRDGIRVAMLLARLRPFVQAIMGVFAVLVVLDGFFGPQVASINLAGVLPWTYWRGLAVFALLLAGNVFCFACPFTAPRDVLRRWLRPRMKWPRALRSKWLALGLLAAFFWSYEAFRLWDSPVATAWIIAGYFVTATSVDMLFEGSSFCKYVCPIGQFHFVNSLASPLEVTVRDRTVCTGCATKDCLRGVAPRKGCEMGLLQPAKDSNFDCTFCLDCVTACPSQNVQIAPVPARQSDVFRTSRSVTMLISVVVFAAFLSAAAMTGAGPLLLLGGSIAALLVGVDARIRTLVPLGLSMWVAHFGYHLLTAGPMLPVPLGRFLHSGLSFSHVMGAVPDWWSTLRVLLLDVGLLRTLYSQWTSRSGYLWMGLAAAMYVWGLWILAQPMTMRGMGMK
jgi:cytochrome c oxidase assembly factor CtaG/polyferredoxin